MQARKMLIMALACAVSACSAEPARQAPVSSPVSYTAKVKNLLTAQPPSDAEVQAVVADPDALRGLIDGWLETPEFRAKMLDFFKQAFQQTQLTIRQFQELVGHPLDTLSPAMQARLIQSVELSFPLTALQLVEEGRPFTEVLTTDRFMLNPPLMTLLTYLDNLVIDDETNVSSWLYEKFGPDFKLTLHGVEDGTQLAFEESIDPGSPNFLTFYEPCDSAATTPRGTINTCKVFLTDPGEEPEDERFRFGGALHRVHSVILGVMFGRHGMDSAVFTEQDWDDWRMLRVRAPESGEEPSIFWDLPRFRRRDQSAQELLLRTPRIGFMTTPAFFANWPTNLSNLARATVNQALIVALGASLADVDAIVPISESGNSDAQHSAPGTSCFACHRTLDPMRNFFRQSFSVTYHSQTLSLPAEQQQAEFTFDGVSFAGEGVHDFAAGLATHPRFARAWTQKLCEYANSASCGEDDPEFLRVAEVFRASNHDFRALVRELFSSPLVTLASPSESSEQQGAVVSIARRDHFCAALQTRLGLPDACELKSSGPTLRQNLAFGIPGAGYARGAAAPLMPREPNLFFVASVENLCVQLAEAVIDPGECPPGRRCWSSDREADALDDFTRIVMALPASDPRFDEVRAVLSEHYGDAVQAGYGAVAALRSAFVLACTSPLSSAVGL